MSGDNRKFGVFSSSVDPEKLSLTIKGLVPFIVLLLPILGFVGVGENELVTFIDQGGAVVFGMITLYGLLRKFWAKRV